MEMPRGRLLARDQGIALVVALLVTVLLVAIIYQFAYSTQIDQRLVRNQNREAQGFYAARGVIALARGYLVDDLVQDGGLYGLDSLNDAWASDALDGLAEDEALADSEETERHGVFRTTIGEVPVEFEIIDEARKIHLNNLVVESVKPPKIGDAASPITALEKPGGPEKSPPPSNPAPPAEEPPSSEEGPAEEPPSTTPSSEPSPEDLAKSRQELTATFLEALIGQLGKEREAEELVERIREAAPFLSVGELLRVEGITPELLYGHSDGFGRHTPGLAEFVTVYSMGTINLNTASREVLIAVLSERYGSDAEALAEQVLEFRQPPDDGGEDEPGDEQPEENPGPPEEEPSESGGEDGEDEEPEEPRGGLFAKVDDLAKHVPGLEGVFGPVDEEGKPDTERGNSLKRQLTVWSRFFSVRVVVGEGNHRMEYRFVLKRGLTPEEPVPVLVWEERPLAPADGSEGSGGD